MTLKEKFDITFKTALLLLLAYIAYQSDEIHINGGGLNVTGSIICTPG